MKYLFLILFAPFYLLGCATDSHAPEKRPVTFIDGVTQVEVKFDKNEDATVGRKVSALKANCKTRLVRGQQQETCVNELIGVGKIVGVNKDISTVEFQSASSIGPHTQYEVLKEEKLE